MIERDWHQCYKDSWKGVIVDDAFAHPAKFSRGLIRRIYEHAIDQGWLEAGDTVVDPFGGVALGALQAMRHGLHWMGVELEPRFVGLGNQNIEKWQAEYEPFFWNTVPGWGTARLVQGDSRDLARVVAEAGCCVSSPPYAESMERSGGIDPAKSAHIGGPHSQMNRSDTRYGTAPGQLGAMPAGEFAAAVSSPPWEDIEGQNAGRKHKDPEAVAEKRAAGYASGELHGHLASKEAILAQLERENEYRYGDSPGQLGQESGPTFWTAARAIVAQTYHVLRPGAVAIWVTKAFVRNKQRVDFPGQWLQLCEAVGFERLEWIRAWLVEDNGTQAAMFGEDKRLVKERKSFFRRLAEKNGSPPINYEVVVIVRKPQ